jgi:hypothetical protein
MEWKEAWRGYSGVCKRGMRVVCNCSGDLRCELRGDVSFVSPLRFEVRFTMEVD